MQKERGVRWLCIMPLSPEVCRLAPEAKQLLHLVGTIAWPKKMWWVCFFSQHPSPGLNEEHSCRTAPGGSWQAPNPTVRFLSPLERKVVVMDRWSLPHRGWWGSWAQAALILRAKGPQHCPAHLKFSIYGPVFPSLPLKACLETSFPTCSGSIRP